MALPRGKLACPAERAKWGTSPITERERLLTRANYPVSLAHREWGLLPAPTRRELIDIIAREEFAECSDSINVPA